MYRVAFVYFKLHFHEIHKNGFYTKPLFINNKLPFYRIQNIQLTLVIKLNLNLFYTNKGI